MIQIILSTSFFAYIWIRFVGENNQTGHLLGIGNIGMAVTIYAVLFFVFGRFIGAFRIGIDRKASLMAAAVLTSFSVNLVELFLSLAITGQFRFLGEFAGEYTILFLIQSAILCILLIPMVNLYRRLFPPLRLLQVHGDKAHGLHDKMNNIEYKYQVVDMIHYEQGMEEIKKRIRKVDAVLISDIPAHEKNMVQKICVDMNKRVYFIPKISDLIVRYSEELNVIDTPLFLRRRIGMSWWQSVVKRTFDIIFSFVSLILFSPIFLITAIAIKLDDGGPVFFRQERVTMGGKRFMILKFRSMIVDAEKDGRPHPAGEKDPRITKVGRVIRSIRLDELPQIWNILTGDMSFVGPRPERWEHVEKYKAEIPEFSFREKVKAGLTGYAQVYGKYNTTALDKIKMDLIYIMNYSVVLDTQIIFETFKILLHRDSTEGFTVERAEEMHG